MRNKRHRGLDFDEMRVTNIHKESDSVTSFILKPIDGQPLPVFHAGQFVVLRLLVDPGKPPILRSYSLSDLPGADHFRISVKSELDGIGSSFLCNRTQEDAVLDVSAPRGSFTLRPGQNPVVLLSAGVGATPVMSMLHALAAEKSQRDIWWIYGARNSVDHPFAAESRSLLKQLSRGRRYIVHSRPAAADQVGADFDSRGHIDTALLMTIGVSRVVTSICAAPLHSCRICAMGCETGVCLQRMCTRKSSAPSRRLPLVWRRSLTRLTSHKGRPDLAPPSHSRVAGLPPPGIRNLEVCLTGGSLRCSCQMGVPGGVCHTCMTGLIGGSIIYDPEPLERPAPGNVLVCCSQPSAAVILDL